MAQRGGSASPPVSQWLVSGIGTREPFLKRYLTATPAEGGAMSLPTITALAGRRVAAAFVITVLIGLSLPLMTDLSLAACPTTPQETVTEDPTDAATEGEPTGDADGAATDAEAGAAGDGGGDGAGAQGAGGDSQEASGEAQDSGAGGGEREPAAEQEPVGDEEPAANAKPPADEPPADAAPAEGAPAEEPATDAGETAPEEPVSEPAPEPQPAPEPEPAPAPVDEDPAPAEAAGEAVSIGEYVLLGTAHGDSTVIDGPVECVNPVLSISPGILNPGDALTVSGSGWHNEGPVTLTVTWAANSATSVTADPVEGAFTTAITVPSTVTAGTYRVHARDTAGNECLSKTFSVVVPQLTSPGEVAERHPFTVDGTGFRPGLNVSFVVECSNCGTWAQASATAAGDTTATATLTAPNGSAGTHKLIAYDYSGDVARKLTETTFTVTTSPAATLSVSPNSHYVGGTVQVTGSNFGPNEPVDIFFCPPALSTHLPPPTATATADADGNISKAIGVPVRPLGTCPVGATGGYGSRASDPDFTVRTASPAVAAQPTPVKAGKKVSITGIDMPADGNITVRVTECYVYGEADELESCYVAATFARIGSADGGFTEPVEYAVPEYSDGYLKIDALVLLGEIQQGPYATTVDVVPLAPKLHGPASVRPGGKVTVTGDEFPSSGDVRLAISCGGVAPEPTLGDFVVPGARNGNSLNATVLDVPQTTAASCDIFAVEYYEYEYASAASSDLEAAGVEAPIPGFVLTTLNIPTEQTQSQPHDPAPQPQPEPTAEPTPTLAPQPEPTVEPEPTAEPTVEPTVEPEPTIDPEPTIEPDPVDPDPIDPVDPVDPVDPDPVDPPDVPDVTPDDDSTRPLESPSPAPLPLPTDEPTQEPTEDPTEQPTDEPSEDEVLDGAAGGSSDEGDVAPPPPAPPPPAPGDEPAGQRSRFTQALQLPSLDLLRLDLMGQNVLIALSLLLLLLASGEIFNATLQENYDEVMGIFHFMSLKRLFGKGGPKRSLSAGNGGGSPPLADLGKGNANAPADMPLDSLGQGGTPDMPLDSLGHGSSSAPQMPLDSLGHGSSSAPQMPLDSLGNGAGSTMPIDTLGSGAPSTMPIDTLNAGAGKLGKLNELGLRAKSGLGLALFIGIGSAIGGLLDPTFGFNTTSLALFLGIGLGLLAITSVYYIAYRIHVGRRYGEKVNIQTIPGGLIVAMACVGLSRAINFEPGYLYGIIAGVAVQRELSAREEGGAVALTSIGILILSLASWFAWIPIAQAASEPNPSLAVLVADASLASIFIAGIEILAFSLLPMKFLDGAKLKAFNGVLWFLMLLVGMFMFVHVLLHPASGFMAEGSLFLVVALLVGFLLFSIAFWAYFRFRQPRSTLPAG